MTADEEDAEILRNAEAARKSGEITDEQERDVWVMVMMSQAEREQNEQASV